MTIFVLVESHLSAIMILCLTDIAHYKSHKKEEDINKDTTKHMGISTLAAYNVPTN
jgi:hypothetical protein